MSKLKKLLDRVVSGDLYGLWLRLLILLGVRRPITSPPIPNADLFRQHLQGGKVASGVKDTSGKPVRVLAFSHNLAREGASISLCELMLALVRQGMVSLEIVAFQDGSLRADYERDGVTVTVLPPIAWRVTTTRRLEREVEQLVSLIRSRAPEVVFANTLLNFPAILAAKRAGVPSIWNPRESEPWNTYFGFLSDPVAQQAIEAIWLPHRVVFVAHSTRAVWKALDHAGNFSVIHNGINLDRFPRRGDSEFRRRSRAELGVGDNDVVALNVGTICPRKGQLDLIEALHFLPSETANKIRVFFVGALDGAYYKKLLRSSRALERKLRERIRFCDQESDLSRYYAAADYFVLCSRIESFPRVILEAMAFGLPVVSTPVFGVTEQVKEGSGGLFYAPEDTQSLASHIQSLAVDGSKRNALATESRTRFGAMTTYREMVDQYADVIRQARANGNG